MGKRAQVFVWSQNKIPILRVFTEMTSFLKWHFLRKFESDIIFISFPYFQVLASIKYLISYLNVTFMKQIHSFLSWKSSKTFLFLGYEPTRANISSISIQSKVNIILIILILKGPFTYLGNFRVNKIAY